MRVSSNKVAVNKAPRTVARLAPVKQAKIAVKAIANNGDWEEF